MYIKLTYIIVRIINCIKAFLVERNQIIDTVHLVQWKIGINAVCPWRTVNQPAAADPAFEFFPFAVADDFCRFIRVELIQACIDTLFLCVPEIDLPVFPGLSIYTRRIFCGSKCLNALWMSLMIHANGFCK